MAWMDVLQTAGPDLLGTNRWTLLAIVGLLILGAVARSAAMVLSPGLCAP